MPTGLELGRVADLPDGEARRDGNPEPARRDQAGDLFQGGGDAAGSEGPAPVGQACAAGDRLGSEATQIHGRGRRSGPDHARPRDPGQLDGEHTDPARRAADQHTGTGPDQKIWLGQRYGKAVCLKRA